MPGHQPRRLRFRLACTLLASLLVVSATAASAPHRLTPRIGTGTLILGWGIEPMSLDPVDNPYWPANLVTNNIYDQLIRVADDGVTLEPDLAQSWTISPDGTVYTFHLRPGVLFQNGQPLTAADVKFCLDRARDPSQTWAWTLSAIAQVAAPDPATVVITLTHPWAPLLADLALFDTGVYPEAYFQSVGESGLATQPVGTGPYALDSWVHGQYLRLRKNPTYWLASQFPLSTIEFDLITDEMQRLQSLQSGALDVDVGLPFAQIAEVQQNAALQAVIDPSTQMTYLVPNSTFAPFGDVKVRQAISHAIDRTALLNLVQFGYGAVANSFLPPGSLYYDARIPVPSYDLTLAKQLLSASSVPNGFSMTMSIGAGDTVGSQVAVLFRQAMAALGITVNIQTLDLATLYSRQQAGQIAFMSDFWSNDIDDPDELVNFAAADAPGSWSFYTWYNNPRVAALAHLATQTANPAMRYVLYSGIQGLWARDQWLLALYTTPYVNGVSRQVQGFHQNPLGYFVFQGVTKP